MYKPTGTDSSKSPAAEKWLTSVGKAVVYPRGSKPWAKFSRTNKGKPMPMFIEVHDSNTAVPKQLSMFDVSDAVTKRFVGYATYGFTEDGLVCGYVNIEERDYKGLNLSPVLFYSLALFAEQVGKNKMPKGATEMPIILVQPDPVYSGVWIRVGFPFKEEQDKVFQLEVQNNGYDHEGFKDTRSHNLQHLLEMQKELEPAKGKEKGKEKEGQHPELNEAQKQLADQIALARDPNCPVYEVINRTAEQADAMELLLRRIKPYLKENVEFSVRRLAPAQVIAPARRVYIYSHACLTVAGWSTVSI